MSKRKAEPSPHMNNVGIRLTDDEFKALCKDAAECRRQPGPQAAWIIATYLKSKEQS